MSQEIHDLIQTCKLEPTEETVLRLLEICEKLDKRIDQLESEAIYNELRMKRHNIGAP